MARALSGGPPELLGKGPSASPGPAPLALGGGSVYWANASGFLAQVSTTGGAVTLLSNPGDSDINAIATDASALYWSVVPNPGGLANAALKRTTFAGATTSLWAQADTTFPSIAVDSQNVYANDGTSIAQIPIDGGAWVADVDQTSTTNVLNGVAVTNGNVYWTQIDTSQPSPPGTLRTVPVGGLVGIRDGSEVVSDDLLPSAIVADDKGVYWSDSSETKSYDPATKATLSLGAAACALALDAQYVYWTTQDGRVTRAFR